MTNEPSEPQDQESSENVVDEDPMDSPLTEDDAAEHAEPATDDVFGELAPDDDPTEPIDADAIDDDVVDNDIVDNDVDDGPVDAEVDHDTQSENLGSTPQNGPAGFPGTAAPAAHYVPLLRDSSGVLGGVGAGIGKRYGLDVSLVRLGMLALAFSGFGILAYFAAWIIIPKSAVPLVASPPHPDQTRKALGAILVGAAVIFGLSALGSSGAVLVPLTLLAAGIWLLMQPPTPAVPSGQTQNQPGGPIPSMPAQPRPTYSAPAGAYGSTQTNHATQAPLQQKKSRTGLKILGGLTAFLSLLLLAGIAIFGATVASEPNVYFEADNDNFQVDFGDDEVDRAIRPTSLNDIPGGAFDTAGVLTLDLTEVPVTAADPSDLPFESEFGVGKGVLEVIIPKDLDIRFKTNVNSGSIEYLDEVYRGNDISEDFGPSDADLILNLNVDTGTIIITEG